MATIQTEKYTLGIVESDGTPKTGALVELKIGASTYVLLELGTGKYQIASIPTGKYFVWIDSVNSGESVSVGSGQVPALGNEADAFLIGEVDNWKLGTITEVKTLLSLENVANIAIPDPTGNNGKVLSVSGDAYQLASFLDVSDKLDKIDPTAQSVVSEVTFEDTITLNTTAPDTPIKTLGRNASNEVIEFDNVVAGGQVDSVVGGTNVTIDNTDPVNPIINATDTDTTISESTGVLTGGVLSTGAGASEYSISDGTGQLVDGVGVITPISWSGKSNITPTNLATNLISWVGINSAGNVVEQVTAFTRAQARTIISLGVVVHVNLTTVDAVNNEQHIAYNAMTSTYDLAESIGFFNVEGNIFSANGANLNIDQSNGKIFKMGSNYDLAPVDNPHVRSLASLTALSFQYRFSDGSNGVTGIAIDPTTLDDGAGGTTTVPNNQFSIQRIYVFTSGNVKLQRGVESFPNLDSALAGYSSEAYVTEPSIEANGLLRGFLVLREDATDLTDTTKVVFISAPKFGEGGGSTGASASALDLQTAYNNSTTPEITTDATNGALTVKRGSALDSDNILEGKNGAGDTTSKITGKGGATLEDAVTIGEGYTGSFPLTIKSTGSNFFRSQGDGNIGWSGKMLDGTSRFFFNSQTGPVNNFFLDLYSLDGLTSQDIFKATYNANFEIYRNLEVTQRILQGSVTDDVSTGIQADNIRSDGDIKADTFTLDGLNTAPSSASDTGTTGEIRWDANYMYVCIATDTWKRSSLATW